MNVISATKKSRALTSEKIIGARSRLKQCRSHVNSAKNQHSNAVGTF
jgi:hypothetical protein